MQRFTIQFAHDTTDSHCPACGELDHAKKGPRLFPVDRDEPGEHGCVHIRPADRDEMMTLGYLQKGVKFVVKKYGVTGP